MYPNHNNNYKQLLLMIVIIVPLTNLFFWYVNRFAETVSSIVPLLAPLSKDIEPVVKQHLAEQLKYLAKV